MGGRGRRGPRPQTDTESWTSSRGCRRALNLTTFWPRWTRSYPPTEKKFFQEHNSKNIEELQSADDKVQHLNMVKTKLEQTLDDLDDSLDREKRQKNEIEKSRRKIEAELKVSQEMVGEIEREKKELES